MTKSLLIALLVFVIPHFIQGQSIAAFADSVREIYNIPELGYAVVSSTRIHELQAIGVKKANTDIKAEPNDKFRIGSNTKAITGFIAAQLVKQRKIYWNTRFFDVFPELKARSNPAYFGMTLLNLLTFRTPLIPYTYTNPAPTRDQFTGDEAAQRFQFTAWFLQQEPAKTKDSISFSNLGYIAAAQMLEKVSGKPYKELVADLGRQLEIRFGFGTPNATDASQPWGHGEGLIPEEPTDDYKLNWLLPAGNIHVSLPDYAQFIQLQLNGLRGQSEVLTETEFQFLHFGLPTFSVGWFRQVDDDNRTYSYNKGNPGTFLTEAYVYKDIDVAFILFANAQTADAEKGFRVLYEELKKRYAR
jgi:CubicO group peptidase (beta-lactamase class C family)